MKHKHLFILAAAFAVMFTSYGCAPDKINTIDIRNEPGKNVRHIGGVLRYGYEGHDYIMFAVNGRVAGVVHDPDCHCFSKNKVTQGLW